MPYFYLIISVLTSASSTIFGKIYNNRSIEKKDASAFYNFIQFAVVFVCWCVLYAFDFSFDFSVLWYSLLFAFCYATCYIGLINALKYGSASLTSLFTGSSLIVTTIWGFVFWGAKITPLVIIGIVLTILSICLCLYTGEKEEKKISWRWLVFEAMAFFGKAGCSIVQRTQQLSFNGAQGNMLMTFATFFSLVVYFIIYWRSDRKDSKSLLKETWYLPTLAGACNFLLNLFVMLMAMTTLSPSLIYPVIGGGSLMVVTVFSLFGFHEKLRWWQWIGLLFGTTAIVFLSI